MNYRVNAGMQQIEVAKKYGLPQSMWQTFLMTGKLLVQKPGSAKKTIKPVTNSDVTTTAGGFRRWTQLTLRTTTLWIHFSTREKYSIVYEEIIEFTILMKQPILKFNLKFQYPFAWNTNKKLTGERNNIYFFWLT